ncbi:uncharacterized protein LOC124966464 isoform X1 [Sciurus carolinensis]|uniref:uncharacterized protein LOC124966464 isoform X1 n=1 Tax=Sciurus carolinensis TaxID=30640 RepID=UPI001FB528A2|nr:uncharacterized protein LOC124966464 isoform X1 [Sciurus carolinensis]
MLLRIFVSVFVVGLLRLDSEGFTALLPGVPGLSESGSGDIQGPRHETRLQVLPHLQDLCPGQPHRLIAPCLQDPTTMSNTPHLQDPCLTNRTSPPGPTTDHIHTLSCSSPFANILEDRAAILDNPGSCISHL